MSGKPAQKAHVRNQSACYAQLGSGQAKKGLEVWIFLSHAQTLIAHKAISRLYRRRRSHKSHY